MSQHRKKRIAALTADMPPPVSAHDCTLTYTQLTSHMLTAMREVNASKAPITPVTEDPSDWASVIRILAKQARRRSKIFYRRVKHTLLSPPAQSTLPTPTRKYNVSSNATPHGLRTHCRTYPSAPDNRMCRPPRKLHCANWPARHAKNPLVRTKYPRTCSTYSPMKHSVWYTPVSPSVTRKAPSQMIGRFPRLFVFLKGRVSGKTTTAGGPSL